MNKLKLHYAAGERITVCGRYFRTKDPKPFYIMETTKDKKSITCKVCKVNLKNN